MAPGSRKSSESSALTNRSRTHTTLVVVPPPLLPPTMSSISSTQTSDAGGPSSRRVRGITVGKILRKEIARDNGKRLQVYVTAEMPAFCEKNATKVANELGCQLRRICPSEGFVRSWKKVDLGTKDAIFQAVQDKFEITENGVENTELVKQVMNQKAFGLYKDWKHRMEKHYFDIKDGGDDPYQHPYRGVKMDAWKHMIDNIFTDPAWEIRKAVGKKSRSALPYLCTLGSRSYSALETQSADAHDGKVPDFCDTYKVAHTLKESEEWISPICEQLHEKMELLQKEASQSETSFTNEELSRMGRGEKKYYIKGFGVGPRPSSYSARFSSNSAHQKELEKVTSELETLREEQRQRDEEQRRRDEEQRQRDEEAQRRYDALQNEMEILKGFMMQLQSNGRY